MIERLAQQMREFLSDEGILIMEGECHWQNDKSRWLIVGKIWMINTFKSSTVQRRYCVSGHPFKGEVNSSKS
jgi:hypothetical protein